MQAVFPLSLLVYFLLNSWIILASNAHALLNDFWPLKQLSVRSQWGEPASFYDGFFPYLYPLLLKFVPDNSLLYSTSFLSLLAACLTITFVYLSAKYLVGPIWAIVAVWIVALQPQFFTYATVSSADSLAALPVAAAIWILIRECNRDDPRYIRVLFLASLFMGVGASLRYHALLLLVIPLVLAVTVVHARLKSVIAAISGFVLGYLPQIFVNVMAGELPWSTSQGFNMYRQAVGVDWNTTDSLDPNLYGSPLSVIFDNPVNFATNYLSAFSNFTFPLVVIVFAAFLSLGTKWSAVLWAMAAGASVFSVVSSTAFSDRTMIVFVPIWAISAAWVLGEGYRKITADRVMLAGGKAHLVALAQYSLITTVLIWGTLPWIQSGLASGIARSELEASRANYESYFLESVKVDSITEVFSNDFNFYTLKVPNFVPQHNGGLAAISQKGTEMAPAINTSGVQPFLCDSLSRNIQATIWNPGNGSGTEAELNSILSGESENSEIILRSPQGLVMSEITLGTDPCSQ